MEVFCCCALKNYETYNAKLLFKFWHTKTKYFTINFVYIKYKNEPSFYFIFDI